MNIQHNVNLTQATRVYIQRNLNVSLFKDNHKLYELADIFRLLTDNLIGVDKTDLKTLTNLQYLGTIYITL
jgi:hypothetical protein